MILFFFWSLFVFFWSVSCIMIYLLDMPISSPHSLEGCLKKNWLWTLDVAGWPRITQPQGSRQAPSSHLEGVSHDPFSSRWGWDGAGLPPKNATGWWFGCHEFYFPIYWVSNHPNWRTHIFQRGSNTNQARFSFAHSDGWFENMRVKVHFLFQLRT